MSDCRVCEAFWERFWANDLNVSWAERAAFDDHVNAARRLVELPEVPNPAIVTF